MENENIKFYDIDWDKVKTIKDIKQFMPFLIEKVKLDHNDENDQLIFKKIEKYITESK